MLGVAILVILAGLLIPTSERYSLLANTAFLFAGLALLLKNGGFVYSKYIRFLNISFAVFILAILFKIQHWPGAGILLIVFPFAVTTIYTLWFIGKENKQLLDILKLFWVPVYLASVIVKMLHFPYAFELNLAQFILFIAMLALLISKNYQKLIKS